MPPNRTSWFALESRDPAGGPREQLFKTARAHPEQRFVRETEFRFSDEFEIHQAFERGVMRGTDILDDDLLRGHCFLPASACAPGCGR